jgi:glycosyltransferase involved in cell wall biosynthesis
MAHKVEKEIMKNWQGDISKPIVSICCITYNHEKYISEAIDSFLMQETDFPFEIVIGEDCSTDNTIKIIEKYIGMYPNIIRLITSKKNVGMLKNGHRILMKSKGIYLTSCEGDDYWTDSNKLQIQVDAMEKNPEISMCFHLSSTLDNKGIIEPPKYIKKNKIYDIKKLITSEFHFVQTNTIIFKKESLKNLNFDLLFESPVGDVWLKISSAMPNGALFINRNMSIYRKRSIGSWTSSMEEDNRFLEYISDMMKSIDNFDRYWDFKYTKDFLIYKNMYIDVVMRKNIKQVFKNDFINNFKHFMSIRNLIKWNILYKYPSFVNLLRIFKNKIKGILYVKTNTK